MTIPVKQAGAQTSLEVFTVIQNGADSVVLVGADGNQTNGLHLAIDGQERILGGAIPLPTTRIVNPDADH